MLKGIFIIVLATIAGTWAFTRPEPNEVTVVNHSKGPIVMQVRCFMDGKWSVFAVADKESVDYPITCPEGDVDVEVELIE